MTEQWLRELGFRPASKYSRIDTNIICGADSMAFCFPGCHYLVHTTGGYYSYVSRKQMITPHQTWLVDNNGRWHNCGQQTRHGILFLLEAQYARLRRESNEQKLS